MANLKELRNRIASVKNTRKITAAMSQIAAARLKKAQEAVLRARPYGERMRDVIEQLVAGIAENDRAAAHPLLATPPKIQRALAIVVTSDRGLAGGFNANVVRAAKSWAAEQQHAGVAVEIVAVGKKAQSALKHAKLPIRATHEAPTLPTIVPLSKTIVADAIAAFRGTSGQKADVVRLFFNEFVSVLTQRVKNDQLLPLAPGEDVKVVREPTYEPSRGAILEHLVPMAIESRLQQAFFNSVAGEIAARRVAMDAATDNASEMIADLTLSLNRERQAAITRELMEIIGGAEALKG